jgi:hypothetical protein
MTDSKHTPGPFYTKGTNICAQDGRSVGIVTNGDKNLAKLFAAAPETAAERDRLAARVAELEGVLRELVSLKHGHPYHCTCPWCEAREVLSLPGGKSGD